MVQEFPEGITTVNCNLVEGGRKENRKNVQGNLVFITRGSRSQVERNGGLKEMWKIKIIYKDNSSCTLTGSHKEIPLELAVNYFNKYVAITLFVVHVISSTPKRIIVRWTCLRKLKNCGRGRILTMTENEARA